MHYLRIQVSGPIAKRFSDRIDGAVRVSKLAACARPDPDGVTFEIMASDDDLEVLLQKLWSLESMGSRDLQMTCKRIRIAPGINPGSGPRTMRPGLVTCEQCRALRRSVGPHGEMPACFHESPEP